MNFKSNSPQPGRQRNSNRTITRLSQKQKMLIGGVVSTLVIVLIVMVYQSTRTTPARAAVAGEYRSKTSGNWGTLATWEEYDGTNWVAATTTPVTADNIITIQNGHIVTVAASVSADQIVIENGGRINVNSGRTLTIANGTGTDMVNNGIIGNTGTITVSGGATINHAAGGTYMHLQNGGTIPNATWNATSNCNITNITTTLPSQISQNYGNLTWNCTGQTGVLTLNTNMSIQSDFTINSTGSSRLELNDGFTSRTFTIGGNYIQTGGNLRLTDGWTSGTMNITGSCSISGGELMGNNSNGNSTIAISSDLNISGTGLLILSSSSASSTATVNGNLSVTSGTLRLGESNGNGTLNVLGHFTHSGGTITETGSATYTVHFKGTTQQDFTSGGTVSNSVNFNVNTNAFLQMVAENTAISGGGTFTLSSAAKLGIKSANGITTSGGSGNIVVTGIRSYNTNADYLYNGTVGQSTGNGLPATNRNLTIDNAAGVTLTSSTATSGTLTLNAGNVTTNANTLTLGTSASVLGTLTRTSGHVVGNFRRWIDNITTSGIVFPVGTSSIYNGITIDFTSAPTEGTISSRFDTGFPGVYGLPVSDAGDECTTVGSGWWTMTGANGFSGGTATLSVIAEGFTGITDYTLLHLFRRDNNASVWEANGTHVAPGGSALVPEVNRSGVTAFGEFGITSSGVNPLPVKLLSFDVKERNKSAVITWSTGSEQNSDYFVVERSTDAGNYKLVQKVNAAGNSTSIRNYEIVDPQPFPGISYYRLVQVDRDGTKEVFAPKPFQLGNKNATALKQLTASPNPFRSDLNLNFESTVAGTLPMIISNQNGKQLYTSNISAQEGFNTISLPLAGQLSPGTYIVTIGEGESKVSTRIIKQ
ncbi:MAG: T9SS type A sorting domain-containing protein [Bacteroidetes bacterium]|nr:T9SS type A sorting domain-containing protein [Bacteroidota bacterium]